MEFEGRVKKLLPMRSGTSARTGNEWQSLPFVFEYFEHETDRYADSVVLETFDTKVIENLKEGMEVICGWSHKAKDIKKQNGEETTINELRLYKIESVRKAAVAQQKTPPAAAQPMQGAIGQQLAPQAQTIYPPQPQAQEGGEDDDLPF